MKKNKTKKKSNKKFLSVLIFIMGLSLFSYPMISGLLSKYNQSTVISQYVSEVKDTSKEEIEKQQAIIEKYNEEINTDVISPEGVSYVDFINPGDILGYIEIPKISIALPIYQGTSTTVLRVGVGHIEKSSLPTTVTPSHVVLTGHTGLPSSKLFTELDKMEEGDLFHIYVLDKKYTYKVDQIKVVLPTETNDLKIEEGKNYTTLITCTPYMINTHRLLVRGELVLEDISDNLENTQNEEPKKEIEFPLQNYVNVLLKEIEYVDMVMITMFLIKAIVIIGILHLLIFTRVDDEEKDKKDEIKDEDIKNDNLSQQDFEDENIVENDFREDELNSKDFENDELENLYNRLLIADEKMKARENSIDRTKEKIKKKTDEKKQTKKNSKIKEKETKEKSKISTKEKAKAKKKVKK